MVAANQLMQRAPERPYIRFNQYDDLLHAMTCEVTMFWASHVPRPKPGPDCQDAETMKLSLAWNVIRVRRGRCLGSR